MNKHDGDKRAAFFIACEEPWLCVLCVSWFEAFWPKGKGERGENREGESREKDIPFR